MTSQTASIAPTPKQRRTQFITAAAGAVLALVTAAGIGGWQLRDQQSASTAGHEAAAPVSAAVTPPAPTTAVREDAVVYLVSSSEQADRVQADIAAARAFVAGEAISLPQATVLVVGTPEDAARVAELLGTEQHVHFTSGRPALRVVDLRPATTSAPPLDPAAFSDQELYSRWLQAQR